MTTNFKPTVVGKELQSAVLEVVKQAKQLNRLSRGINECTKQTAKSRTKLVVIAADIIPPQIAMHLPELCEDKGVACCYVTSRVELGKACGLNRPAVSVCIKNVQRETPLDKKINEICGRVERGE